MGFKKRVCSRLPLSLPLSRIKNFIDERCRKTFYHAYIHNKLEYGLLLFWGAAAHQLRPLKSLQKRALKLVVKNSSTNIFKAACVLPLQYLTDFQRSLKIMKSTNDLKSLNTSKHYLHCVLMATIDLDYASHGWIYTNPIVYLLVPLCLGTLCLLISGVPWGQYRWIILKENLEIIALVK